MDEPTRGLDVVGSQVVFEFVASLRTQGKAVIVVDRPFQSGFVAMGCRQFSAGSSSGGLAGGVRIYSGDRIDLGGVQQDIWCSNKESGEAGEF